MKTGLSLCTTRPWFPEKDTPLLGDGIVGAWCIDNYVIFLIRFVGLWPMLYRGAFSLLLLFAQKHTLLLGKMFPFDSRVFLSCSTRRLSQRMVTTDLFYRNVKGEFDNVMVLVRCNEEQTFGVCFAFAHCHVSVEKKDNRRPCHQNCIRSCPQCSNDPAIKLCLTQYIHLLEEWKFSSWEHW